MGLELTVEQKIELTPQQRTLLENRLLRVQKLRKEIEELEDRLMLAEADIEDARQSIGFDSLDFPGYGKVTHVPAGEVRRLNQKKLLAQGVTLAQIEAAKKGSPRKAYTLITLPGEKPKKSYGDDE